MDQENRLMTEQEFKQQVKFNQLIVNVLRNADLSDDGRSLGEMVGDALGEALGRDGSTDAAITALEISGELCKAAHHTWSRDADGMADWDAEEFEQFYAAVLRQESDFNWAAKLHYVAEIVRVGATR